jgi:hypothetical protein
MNSPVQAAKNAKSALIKRFDMWKFGRHGERRFRDDPRYNLQHVTDGFASRIDLTSEDTSILKRICTAYQKAAQDEESFPDAYQASERWQQIRRGRLGPVLEALRRDDTEVLGRMYRNFFRDSCSFGILGPPNGMAKEYFSGKIRDMYRRYYLSHVLYRLDYWKSQTEGKFALKDLAGPVAGNPFGAVIDGVHIRVGAEYAHYCAYRVGSRLEPGKAILAEVKGGFGGMAYYLLRDRQDTTYIDFDVPETIALASYYLMKAYPALRFLLYGEEAITPQTISQADIVMMPMFALASMPAGSVDAVFSSYGMSDLSRTTTADCLNDIDRITRTQTLFIDNQRVSEVLSNQMKEHHPSFKLSDTRESGWHSFRVSGAGVGGAAGLADSVSLELSYARS